MSNTNTAVTTVPAHIAARVAARQQQGGKSTMMSAIVGDGLTFPKISTKGSRYRLVEDGVETPVGITLDVIVVGANPNTSKIFYSKPYDGSEAVRPDCFSHDGKRPDPSVEAPINASCVDCPHNVLGSKMLPSGAKSKLCADQRHLAVIAAADPGKVYALTVPVSGMKALREYFKDLQNYGLEPQEVVTQLGFDDQASYPKITFTRKGYVNENALPKIDAVMDSDEVKEVVRLVPPRNRPALSAPAANAALAQAKPAAASVDEAYEEAPTPAPAAAPAKAAKAAPKVEPVKASSELEQKLDNLFA